MSRRSLLTKAAAVGAAGIAGSLLLNRPRDVFASFTWTGGAANAADAETFVTANAAFANPAVLSLDGSVTNNPNANIDGLRAYGTGGFSGIAAVGGNKGGAAYYGNGGPATGTGQSGTGLMVWAGSSVAGQTTGKSIQGYQNQQQNGLYTYNAILGAAGSPLHSSLSNGLWSWAGDHGWGIWGDGGWGNLGSPNTGGGVGVYANSGPGSTGLVGFGDNYHYNDALGANGVAGFGNALGVGGWFTGGRALFALGSTSTAGPPTTNAHSLGDVMLDVNRVLWICTVSGTPGTFTPLQPGGWNNSLFSAVSTQQYTLVGNNGTTWVNMDATNLKLTITPSFECRAVFTVSADLWTAAASYNQDIGVALTGGVYPTTAGQPEGWKESSGSAAFSPNAAHLDVIVPLAAGTTYTAQVVWKTNKNAPGILIAAGAGPIGGKFSPTSINASLVATNVGGTKPLGPEKPYEIPAEMQVPQQKPGVIPKPRS